MLSCRLASIATLALILAPVALAQTDGDSSEQHRDRQPEPLQQYTVTNLVSNQSGVAAFTDPNLVNSWGISRSSGGPWWVSDNGTGLATLYNGDGSINGLVVQIPPSDPSVSSTGTPTGTIFNGTTDFTLAVNKPAVFLFATEDGTISGWNPGVDPTQAKIVVNEKKQTSVFKGLTEAQASVNGSPLTNYLYAADFRKGKVAVYNASFQHAREIEEEFAEVSRPRGYAPFNVQNIGGNIYVAYGKQDAAKHDEVDGQGLGFVAIFHADGHLIRVLEPGAWFNAPWGLAVAPSDFGAYSHDVLVGNFGDGAIHAFDPITGRHKGQLRDAKDNPIQIDGLWALVFGNGAAAGPANALYFAAGPNHEQNGLMGNITPIQNNNGNDQ